MLQTAFILALAVLFIHATTWEGMINSWVGKAFFDAPGWLKKPLYDCPICMAPWWGFLIYMLWGLFGDGVYLPPMNLAIVLAAAGGINAVLIYIISYAKEQPAPED